MKIGIIGAGAMGSVYAGLMADAGHEVWMFDKWVEHVDAINADGLKVEGASGERTAKPNATTNAADAGECELAIVATKGMQTKAAVEDARPMIGAETAVWDPLAENCIDNIRAAARAIGEALYE